MLWMQIGNDRVSEIPADGQTSVDAYATFFWNGAILEPERSDISKYVVNFAIGKGNIPNSIIEDPPRTVQELLAFITPVDGVELEAETVIPEFQVVNGETGGLEILPAAKARIKPINDPDVEGLILIAFTQYDQLGEIERLSFDHIDISLNAKVGGSDTFLKEAEKYDISANSWSQIAEMSEARVAPMTEAFGGLVHVFGGFDGIKFLSSHEVYDPATDTWSFAEPITAGSDELPLAFGHSFVNSGKIFLVGGLNQGFTSASMLSFDPGTGAWTLFPKMPQGVAMGTATLIGDVVYVMFGATRVVIGSQEDSVERFNLGVFSYDLTTGTSGSWTIEKVATASPETTALAADIAVGGEAIETTTSPSVGYGVAIIDDGGANEELVCWFLNQGQGPFRLTAPATKAHSAGESFKIINVFENRIGPNSFEKSGKVRVLNGLSFLGQTSAAPLLVRGAMFEFDPATKAFTDLSIDPTLPRGRGAAVTEGGTVFIAGGSGDKSEWLDELETHDIAAETFSDKSEMIRSRHSFGMASTGSDLYATGGAGSGHPPGWLQIDTTANPENVRADGKETSSIVVTALDDSGDPPPDGTTFQFKGVISLPMTDTQRQQFQDQLRETLGEGFGSDLSEAQAPQRISILPVLFSSNEVDMQNGESGTILLERSEDPIQAVENLFNFLVEGEVPQSQEAFKALEESQRSGIEDVRVGTRRNLYSAFIETKVVDDFFFGETDTDLAIYVEANAGETDSEGNLTDKAEAAAGIKAAANESLGTGGFSLVRSAAEQRLSVSVAFFSDITSIPDVAFVSESPVGRTEAKVLLDSLKGEIPFGASPHYDALLAAGQKQADDASSPRCAIVSVSDNEQSLSAATPEEVIDTVNSVNGDGQCPIFITSFVVTEPITLAARRARTDVADLERISDETGGNSFSIVDESYIDFVIDRIKASAPSALSSTLIVGEHELDGPLQEIVYRVTGLATGDTASMQIFFSDDGYTFEDSGILIDLDPADGEFARHVFDPPVKNKHVRFSLTMSSKSFRSPRLRSIAFDFVEPNVQFIFTLPITVSGQVAELAAIVNHRLPEGSEVEVGLAHGDSFVFDRDYVTVQQPSIRERGVIMVINRSFDTFVDGEPTNETLLTDDFRVYRAPSGPWKEDSLTILVNNEPVLPAEFESFPEKGLISFATARLPTDVVQISSLIQPSQFRVGVKITNPTLEEGRFDDFAFSWTGTEGQVGGRQNRTPRAVNLFISPLPALPGGPLTANFTFSDPDGDEEDQSQTLINWFRNGVPIPELANKRTISDRDFIAGRPNDESGRIKRRQEWFFTVRPSDGISFGPLATSPKITISNQPPVVESARLISSNADPLAFTTVDTVSVELTVSDADADATGGNIFSWFVDEVLVKSGKESTISPGETDSNGDSLLRPDGTVRVQITPFDGTDFGDEFSTESVTVSAAPPSVSNVEIIPATPSLLSNLRVEFDFSDPSGLEDQSRTQWFRNGVRVTEIDDVRLVSRSLLSPGQEWQVAVIPSNGLSEGQEVRSNTVKISF